VDNCAQKRTGVDGGIGYLGMLALLLGGAIVLLTRRGRLTGRP